MEILRLSPSSFPKIPNALVEPIAAQFSVKWFLSLFSRQNFSEVIF